MTRTAADPARADPPPWANLSATQQTVSVAVFAVAYVTTAVLAKDFDLANGVAAWYPPAAAMFAFLLVAGPRFVPVAFVVGIASDLITYPEVVERDGPASVAAGAMVVAGVYAWGAWVLRRNRLDHAQLRQFGWFAVIGVAACPLLASAGFALVQVVAAGASSTVALEQASTYWVGDAVAIASIVPFVLLLAASRRRPDASVRLPDALADRIEIVAQAVAVVVVPVGIFAARSSGDVAPFLFLAIIPVIWVALRQNLLVASFGILVTNTVVAFGARARLGSTDDFVAVQTLMLAAALAALYAGAVRRTESKQLAETMERESRYRTLVEHSPALVARFDPTGDVVLHAGSLDPAGSNGDIVRGLAERWDDLSPAVADGGVTDLEWSIDAGADTRWLETRAVAERSHAGEVSSVLTVTSDRTSMHRAVAELAASARRDPLTGLPNRTALDELLESGARDPEPPAVVALLLDRADVVTAGLGRRDLDAIAVAMAERLGRVIGDGGGEGDVLARIGSTSFAALTHDGERSARLASAAVDAMAGRFDIADVATYLHVSAGISGTVAGLAARVEHAELAARVAQEAGGSRVAVFDPSMTAAADDTRGVIHGLRRALDHGELVVHYQPIVALDDGRVLGAEALVRWDRPGHGLVGPAEFIEVAERSGLIDDVGAAVERLATEELVGNRGALGGPAFALNLNISAHQLSNRAFPGRIGEVLAALERADVALHLELTETAILADPAQACTVLAELRDCGARIVLDDFGTGFSAISWLHQLPVDAIKLDRTFVTGLPDDEASVRIARLVTALANELDLDLTAEGVETEQQRRALIDLGCSQAQGYLFGRPGPLADLHARRTSG